MVEQTLVAAAVQAVTMLRLRQILVVLEDLEWSLFHHQLRLHLRQDHQQ